MIPRSLLLANSCEGDGILNYDSEVLSEILMSSSSWKQHEDTQLLEIVQQCDDSSTINWMEVSERIRKSPQECFSRYHNVLSYKLNASEWSTEENDKLMQLVRAYGPYNWVFLSAELDTNRSPVECLRHFQRFLNSEKILHSDWTTDEDCLLKQAIDKHGLAWNVVSECIPRRTATQCMFRYRKSLDCHGDAVSGRWTEMEERKLFVLAHSFEIPKLSQTKALAEVIDALFREGKVPDQDCLQEENFDDRRIGWGRVSELLTGKTPEQCREKWSNNLDPTISHMPFSKEEDNVLLILVNHFGEGEWTKIARYLPGRTDASVRRRWFQLKRIVIK